MQNLLKFTTLLFLFGLFSSNSSSLVQTKPKVSHAIFDGLLQKHVTPEGAVNYKGFIQDKALFEKYLTLLQSNHPDKKTWSKNEQLAYWINAYNALTVDLIIKHYLINSIKDIEQPVKRIFLNGLWGFRFNTAKYLFQVLSLNCLHGIEDLLLIINAKLINGDYIRMF